MSPNITLSWVLALAPEIGLLVVLFMVLVFDNRFLGAMNYFPPTQSGESPPRMAVNIVGTPDAYSVQTTGVQFEHDSREFCVLMIDQTWALDAGQ